MILLEERYNTVSEGIFRTVTAGTLSGESLVRCVPTASVPLAHQWWTQKLRGCTPEVNTNGVIRTVDLFCGPGGLSLGAGYAIEAVGQRHSALAALDVDAEAVRVYDRNFRPALPIVGNVSSIVDYHVYGRGETARLAYAPELVDERLQQFVGGVDVLLAGPPCQGHSNLNNHTRRSDPRNVLYVTVAATAIALKARALVIENVREVLADKTDVVGTASRILAEAGYSVSSAILHADDLGGAQTRRRHFLVATRDRPHHPLHQVAEALRQPPMQLINAIGDLVGREPVDFMDQVSNLSMDNRRRIDWLFDNDKHELINDERPDCHKDGHTYDAVYGRLHWDRPAQTITTGFMTPGRGRYIHPSERRALTPREAARIQGFPDSYEFTPDGNAPTKKALQKWIGDAVPGWLGYAATLAALTGF